MPDDTQVPPHAAAEEERGVEGGEAGAPPADLPADAGALAQRVRLLEAQLEESFARSRETNDRLRDTHDRLLRSAAEVDNLKKRVQKEKDDLRKYAAESLLKDFLPVLDNLERALDHAESHDPMQVIEGVRLVQKLFETTLGKHGVTGFSARGKPFDPSLHEALMQQESEEPPGTVVGEMAKGYKLHDRLIRPAAVMVAKPKEAGPTAAPDGGEGA